LDGRTITRVSKDGEGEIIEAASAIVFDSRGRKQCDIITVCCGRESLVVKNRESDFSTNNVLDDELKDVILRTIDRTRREMIEVVFSIFNRLADGLVGLKDLGLLLRRDLNVVLNGMKFAVLLFSSDNDPEGVTIDSGFLSIRAEGAVSKMNHTILSISNSCALLVKIE